MSKKKKLKALLDEAVEISVKCGIDIKADQIIDCYSQSHRYWHTPQHLLEMMEGVKELYKDKKVTQREYFSLMLAAVFHDIVYDPKRNDNEEKSAEYMMSRYDGYANPELEKDVLKARDIILDTKTQDSQDGLSRKFNKLDTAILDSQFIEMLDWENKIYKEYKWIGWKQYKKKRIQFLLSSIKGHSHNVLNIKNLIDYIQKKVPKTGICYYEIDKLSPIEEFNEKNRKIEKLFDDIIILLVYKISNDREENRMKIKEYATCSYNDELYALDENSVCGFISKRDGEITVVKELKYMNDYNKDIEKQMSEKIEDFRVIYI